MKERVGDEKLIIISVAVRAGNVSRFSSFFFPFMLIVCRSFMYRVCLLWASLFELKAIENTKKITDILYYGTSFVLYLFLDANKHCLYKKN